MKIEIINYSDKPLEDMIQKSKYDNDAGIDIKLLEDIMIDKFTTLTVDCGFGLKLPAGVMAQLITRSSISKQNIVVGNAPIDSSYTGEIHLMISNNTDKNLVFYKGNRIAQLVIIPIINFDIVDKLKLRETNGLGSSGK